MQQNEKGEGRGIIGNYVKVKKNDILFEGVTVLLESLQFVLEFFLDGRVQH